MKSINVKIKGESPLLLHNGQVANPRNRYAKSMKQISGKRKKVDADYDALAKLEWLSSLYFANNDLIIPDYVLEAVFIGGAKKSRRSPEIKAGMFFTNHASLQFDGKPSEINLEELEKLFDQGNYLHEAIVRVGQAKVVRTRPIFRVWECEAVAQYDPSLTNLDAIKEIADDAGRQVGIGDWRPKYGRFAATVEELD